MPNESIDCIITSPPYWGLRDYGVKGQLGLEKTINEFIENMLLITTECKRVLKKEGVMFWNHGDSYGNGSGTGYEKSLTLQAHRLAIRMIDEQGWTLRNTIIWHKPNAMPSLIHDRFGVDFEPIFFFSKSKKYYFKQQFEDRLTELPWDNSFNVRVRDVAREKIASDQYKATENEIKKYKVKGKYGGGGTGLHRVPGQAVGELPDKRGMRTVWKINAKSFDEAHFATFPEDLVVPMMS